MNEAKTYSNAKAVKEPNAKKRFEIEGYPKEFHAYRHRFSWNIVLNDV